MSLNVRLEDVPDAILEAVKARIMSNRRRLQQPRQRESLRPGPQFRKFGADGRTWRRPEPAAVAGGGEFVSHVIVEQQLSRIFKGEIKDLETNIIHQEQLPHVLAGWRVFTGDRSSFASETYSFPFSGAPAQVQTIDLSLDELKSEIGDGNVPRGFIVSIQKRITTIDGPLVNSNFPGGTAVIVLPAGKDKSIVICKDVKNTYESTWFFKYRSYRWFYDDGTADGYPSVGAGIIVDIPETFSELKIKEAYPPDTYKAYLCSNKKIKEISVKGQLLNLISQNTFTSDGTLGTYSLGPIFGIYRASLFNSYAFSPRSEEGFQGFKRGPFANPENYPGMQEYLDSVGFFLDELLDLYDFLNIEPGDDPIGEFLDANDIRPFYRLVTPSVFAVLAKNFPELGIDLATLKQPPPESKHLYTDTRYSTEQAGFYQPKFVPRLTEIGEIAYPTRDVNEPFRYMRRRPTGEYIAVPGLKVSPAEDSVPLRTNGRTGEIIEDDPVFDEFDPEIYAVWDWNDPAYCRRMCLALGFTPEDLRF